MNAPEAIVPLLKTVPYLAGLNSDVLKTIAVRSQSKSFRAGQPVFTEGDTCHHLYLLEHPAGEGRRAQVLGLPGSRDQAFARGEHR